MRKSCSLAAVAASFGFLAACAPKPLPTPIILAPTGIDWKNARVLAVSMTDYEFTPPHPVLRLGQPVRLVIVNTGGRHHEFSAPAFFASATYRASSALPVNGKITLAEGEKTEVDLIPKTPGEYPLECTVFMHASFGMTGAITVSAGAS
jgi:uncharacterized cupredoxin-like copper-binding protein